MNVYIGNQLNQLNKFLGQSHRLFVQDKWIVINYIVL